MLLIISPLYKKNYATVRINLQYIKRLQALKYWLHKFDSFLDRDSKQHGKYAAVYESYFHTCCGLSFYNRVCNSILVYEYGMQKERTLF